MSALALEDVEAARRAGVNGYLAKPVKPGELRWVLEGKAPPAT